MDTTKAVTHLGLCAGYGGIELGLKRAIPSLRTIALCEIEAFAIANLVSKMEAGLMDPAPIWPDLKTFPWQSFRDRVDILTGGYPCQPFSAAGKRLGGEDPRHLWPHISRGISILQPRVCFFENVEGHITCGLHHVLCDLGRLGYRTTWGIFSASECGAPHQRKRVFIMAVSSGFRGTPGLSGSFTRHEGQSGESDDGGDQGMADTECGGLVAGRIDTRQSQGSESKHCSAWPSRPGEQQYGWEPPRVVADTKLATGPTEIDQREKPINQDGSDLRDEYSASSSAMADSHRIDRSEQAEGREHDRQAGPAGEELGDTGCERQEERQVEAGGSEQSDQDLGDTGKSRRDNRDKSEQSIQVACRGCGENNATDSGQTQPPLGGDPDGSAGGLDYAQLCVTCDNRTDELRLLGNGVVPHTAELAFRVLIQELANE